MTDTKNIDFSSESVVFELFRMFCIRCTKLDSTAVVIEDAPHKVYQTSRCHFMSHLSKSAVSTFARLSTVASLRAV